MSGSDREVHADGVRSRLGRATGARSEDDDLRDDGAVKRSIDQVADKVKGLLRSDR